MSEHICKGDDSDVLEGREACYQAWSEHRDYWEEGDRVNAHISDFRCGFVHGFEAQSSELAQLRTALAEAEKKVRGRDELLKAARKVLDYVVDECKVIATALENEDTADIPQFLAWLRRDCGHVLARIDAALTQPKTATEVTDDK